MNLWPHQTRVLNEIRQAELAAVRAMVVASATGTGKSRVMYELVKEAAERHERLVVYCNRRLLFHQLASGLQAAGLPFGARAAGQETNLDENIQLAMIQTERSKVLSRWGERKLHQAKRVLVDEAHLAGSGAAQTIIKAHKATGATIIGFSATPVGIGHLYDKLIVGAGTAEGRECGALLPAMCFDPNRPSSKLVHKVLVREKGRDGQWTDVWLKAIHGSIVENWEILNPQRRPTILFAPGVPESRSIAKRLYSQRIKAAHIDAKGVWTDGKWWPGDKKRQEVLERIQSGDLEIISNRWCLREAIDIPGLYHCILATRFGTETTYLQAVGRVLRNHPSLPGKVLVQDHGGNIDKFGSPNENRTWHLSDTAEGRDYIRKLKRQKGELVEPYTCPKCFAKRLSGAVCHNCGHYSQQQMRVVVELDGTLRPVKGPTYRKPEIASDKHLDLWKRTYWSHYKRGKTFRQALAAFGYKIYERTGQYAEPNPEWPFMPIRTIDFLRRVRSVPHCDLVPDVGDVSNVFFEDSQWSEGADGSQVRLAQGEGGQRPLVFGGR